MAISHNKPYLSKQKGLTLIEVLIALVIMSVAIIAVMKSVSQSIRTSHHLLQKTTAGWIAQETINELQAGKTLTDFSTTVLAQKWYVTLNKKQSKNPAIKEVTVLVFPNEYTKDEETPLLTVDTYVYQPT